MADWSPAAPVPGIILSYMYTLRDLRCIHVAAATIVVYDHLTTIAAEIDLVWRQRKWSIVNILFLLNRYGGEAALVGYMILSFLTPSYGWEKKYVDAELFKLVAFIDLYLAVMPIPKLLSTFCQLQDPDHSA
ncbi:hypothetical protein AMATHDRAFT_6690 [Amanita thiersii Skay4041]|uniref:DUF6533 domain-containing protein n=1 Tax=Amanita thiersii Skay4041 TaxID=703135 RepID=A0A2A9NIE5_9AGAR|nr:hypothetical protein AMATHDRAFT_6690 [Amanita thiersii Skay4041]